MPGVLYGVGVGPGDPELVTLKAKRIIEGVHCVAVPKTGEQKGSLALSIVEDMIENEKEILELLFPMSYDEKLLADNWNNAVLQIRDRLDAGRDVAFITLGDPTVYSTYMYIHKTLLREGYRAEIIPGITSFCASAARAGISLAENRETIAVIPSAYECENLDHILDSFDNIVLMKVSRNLGRLKEKLREKGMLDKAALVSKCGFEDETVALDMEKVDEKGISYFTTVIVKRNGVG